MKDFLLAISFLIVVTSVALFFGNMFLITKPQVQEGFSDVGKILVELDARLKKLEPKK